MGDIKADRIIRIKIGIYVIYYVPYFSLVLMTPVIFSFMCFHNFWRIATVSTCFLSPNRVSGPRLPLGPFRKASFSLT